MASSFNSEVNEHNVQFDHLTLWKHPALTTTLAQYYYKSKALPAKSKPIASIEIISEPPGPL